AISSLSNSETRETIKQDTPSLAHVDARLQTVPGASSYSTGSSSVQSSLFDGVIFDKKLLLVERDDPVSPSSASSGFDPQLFDASIFRSPTSHKENIHPAQKTSKPLTIAFGQTPVVTHPSSLSHHPGVPSEGDISLVCNNYQSSPNTRMSSDTAASSDIPLTEQLLQHVISWVTRVHRQCTSTCNPGTDRTIRVFGPNGYSAFERGLKVLRKIYKGIIPRSADDICALLQVTLQFLSCVPSRANDNWWSLSRNDLHLWSDAIQDEAERDLFTEAINILWVSWKCWQRRRPCASPHRTAQASSSHTSPSAADKEEQSSRLAGGPVSGRSSLDQALRDSAVIRICSRFLDGKSPTTYHQPPTVDKLIGRAEFEWCDLDDKRNSFTPPFLPDRVSRAAENLKFMRDNLIQPLLRFSSFRQDVLTVEEQVARGFLYTVREVEVMLMHHVLSVRVHCDKALSPDSEICRTRQYRTDLTQMKAISRELKKRASRKPMEQKAGNMWDHTESYRKGSTDNPIQPSLGGFIEARSRDTPPPTYASIENGAIGDISTTTLSRRSILTPVLASSCSPEAYSTIFGGAGQRMPYCASTPATRPGIAGPPCTNRQSCDQNKTRNYVVKDEAKSKVLSHAVVLVIGQVGSSGEVCARPQAVVTSRKQRGNPSLEGRTFARRITANTTATAAQKSSLLSSQRIQAWQQQQTSQRHEQIAMGCKTYHSIPESYKRETEGTRADVRRFDGDADAAAAAAAAAGKR
ncbi:MAG: hypothetical protein LQ345_003066, partial [Seirophora villosa]